MEEDNERKRQIVVLAAGYMYLNHIEVLKRRAEVRRQEDEEAAVERRSGDLRALAPRNIRCIPRRRLFHGNGDKDEGSSGMPAVQLQLATTRTQAKTKRRGTTSKSTTIPR